MKILNKFLCFLVLLSLVYNSQAEKENKTNSKKYELKLKTGSIVPEVIDITMQKRSLDIEKYCFDSYYYAVLQFNEIPNFKNIQKLKLLDVHLGNYIPENAYRAKIPTGVSHSILKEYDVRSIYFLKPEHKISTGILNKLNSDKLVREELETKISVRYDQSLKVDEVSVKLNKLASKVEFNETKKEFFAKVTESEILSKAKLPFIYFIDEYEANITPLAGSATVQTRGKYFHNLTTGIEPKLTGKDVKIGVVDQVTHHVDLKNRGAGLDVDCLSYPEDGHSSLTRGLVGGNGNIDPDLMGMAPESIVVDEGAYEINSLADGDVLASAHPYPLQICPSCPDAAYSTASQQLDQDLKLRSDHLAIFSAGNSGKTFIATQTEHDYPNYFNTLSNRGQTSKNTLTVGGITNLDLSHLSSSRGPSSDGRVKPELVAEMTVMGPSVNNTYGSISGTSFSAPIVAGGVALLGEAYENLNIDDDLDGEPDLPKAGLLKAILCNTADDLGNPGPDFTFGFGRPNFKRAYESLNTNQYIVYKADDVDLLDDNSFHHQHLINVPESVSELNVTLYWPDAEGDIALEEEASQLVNDLNLYMRKSGEPTFTYKPYTLNNVVSNKDNVNNPAIISKCNNDTNICMDQNGNIVSEIDASDHLNNIEKITLENPTAGNWAIGVDGLIRDAMKYQSQEYFIAYELRYSDLELTYPIGGESFKPGQTFYITWEAPGDYEGFEVHYKDVLNPALGSPWIPIETDFSAIGASYDGTDLPPTQIFYKWKIPTDFPHTRTSICITGNKSNGEIDRACTSESINIISTPNISQTIDYENQKVTLSWTSVEDADRYEVYKLGDEIMESQGSFLEGNNIYEDGLPALGTSNWYSVKAIDDMVNGIERDSVILGKRTVAVEVVNEYKSNPLIKVFLEGCYNTSTGEHNTDLYNRKLLPGMMNNPIPDDINSFTYVSPYDISPWNYPRGYKIYSYGRYLEYENSDVDWVLVSLRTETTKDSEVVEFTGILTKSGHIRLIDHQHERMCSDEIGDGPFYIVVEHRNHLPVMSPSPVEIIDGQLNYDFTKQDSYRNPASFGQKQLSDDAWAAFAGNCFQDNSNEPNPTNIVNDINGGDKVPWTIYNGEFYQYDPTDMNLDGDVNGEDKGVWFDNNGVNCTVPQ